MSKLDTSDTGFILFDSQHRLVSGNVRFAAFYALADDALQAGMPLREVLTCLRDSGRIRGVEVGDEQWLDGECQRLLTPGPTLRRQLSDGRWLSLQHTTTDDEGLLCLHQDVSAGVAEERGRRRRKILDGLAYDQLRRINLADDLESALNECLTVTAEVLGFDFGHAWAQSLKDPDKLVPTHISYARDPDRFRGFRQLAETTDCVPGHGLTGRALNSGRVESIDDVATDDDVLRAIEAGYCGLRAGLAWPLVADGQGIAILEFYSQRDKAPPADVVAALQSLSQLIGEVLNEKQRKHRFELLQQALEQHPSMVFLADIEGQIEYTNAAMIDVSGYDRKALTEQTPAMFLSGMMPASVYADIWRHVRYGEPWQGELHHQKRNGETFWSNTSLSPIRDRKGQVSHCLGISTVSSERKESSDRIEHLAFYDGLTGLPNIAFFMSQLKQQIARARRDSRRIALLLIDIDNFKQVNDALGYEGGDELLQRVASRLQAALRECDLIARTGGDEFAALIEIDENSGAAADLARRTIDAVARGYMLEDRELNIEASIGISTYPEDAQDPEELLRNAGLALQRGKQQGASAYHFYAAKLDASVRDRKALEDLLRDALGAGQLRLWYQPLVDARTRLISGAEALIRWQHPQRGLVPPADFIPMAEQSGLIIQIGAWAIEQACEQLAQWQRLGLPEVNIAVNLSVVQFQHHDLLRTVRDAIERSGIEPGNLTLEITESVVMEKADHNLKILQALRALGPQISLDDFGTGYSSLSYLTRFPVNKIKIDRSFVNEIFKDEVHLAIVDAVVKLGRVLGARINVEGVETQEQFDLLVSRNIDEVQGFYFSKPVPPEEFGELLLLNQMARRREVCG